MREGQSEVPMGLSKEDSQSLHFHLQQQRGIIRGPAQSHQRPAESSALILTDAADRLSENPTKLPNPDARHAGTGMTGMMSSDCSHSQASSRPTRSTRGVKVMYNKYYKEKGFLPPLVQK